MPCPTRVLIGAAGTNGPIKGGHFPDWVRGQTNYPSVMPVEEGGRWRPSIVTMYIHKPMRLLYIDRPHGIQWLQTSQLREDIYSETNWLRLKSFHKQHLITACTCIM